MQFTIPVCVFSSISRAFYYVVMEDERVFVEHLFLIRCSKLYALQSLNGSFIYFNSLFSRWWLRVGQALSSWNFPYVLQMLLL